MIKSFKDREAEKIFRLEPSRRYGGLERVIGKKLTAMHAALIVDDLRNPPGNRLEALRGSRKGQYSIRINDQFRICFVWKGDVYDVEIVDYH